MRTQSMRAAGEPAHDGRADNVSLDGLSDEELLRAVAGGDSAALLSLHQKYAGLVYSMAYRVLNDAQIAEEITQDVFVKLWQKAHRYDPERGRFTTWLLSVTRFAAIDRLRGEGRRPQASTLEDTAELAPPPQLSQADHRAWEEGQMLRLMVQQLPPDQRQVVELAYFGGLTHSELAEHLGLPLGTVKGRLRLGLEKLRTLWLQTAR